MAATRNFDVFSRINNKFRNLVILPNDQYQNLLELIINL